MTRSYVYFSALVAFTAATAMIVASIFLPAWITYSVTSPQGDKVEMHVGLHRRCINFHDPPCTDYPTPDMCQGEDGRTFCSMWKTVGFLASLSAILCLASLVSFLVIIKGGKYKRETGWPFVTGMLTLVSLVEFFIVGTVSYLSRHDDQFAIPGFNLDVGWQISLASAVICLLGAAGLAASAYLLPPEDGYSFLEDADA
ncbi:uncharacterized protein UV8b_04651 [Ustilaginoidea virens]|uniref:Pre-mRNA splicing factor n=1 Tax=Ustilaginoidea virens TaxID=1159556 RepID=A0A8E5HRP0_USTVR|nr:uncharacterized protein UV8b_04651 [Ustilaginoidea virens]QUC20410.1 hypothetical protein UV8b_04651 [Ustilaginoidea virens]